MNLNKELITKVLFSNKNILIKFIKDITNIDYKLLKENLIIEKSLTLKYGKNKYIELEVNNQSYTGMILKNLFAGYQVLNSNKKIIKIVITSFDYEEKSLIKYKIDEERIDTNSKNEYIFYLLNISKCIELYSNNKKDNHLNYIYWGSLLSCNNIDDIFKIASNILNKEEIDIIIKTLKKEIISI